MQQSSTTIIILHPSGAEILTDDGELLSGDYKQARRHLQEIKHPPIVIHAPSLFKALEIKPVACFDLLELFAFVHPARFCVPTASGLGHELGIEVSGAVSIPFIIEALLQELRTKSEHLGVYLGLTQALQKSGWAWSELAWQALQENPACANTPIPDNPFEVWQFLPDWQETSAGLPAGDSPVSREASDKRLTQLLGAGAEMRQGQHDYCEAVSSAFQPKQDEHSPNLVLAEGGTGIGKTYGYLAPATLWSELNQAPVWISTYTRNLQHQIYNSMVSSYGKKEASKRTVIRKGRENYLCLENYAQHARAAGWKNELPMALMALWILHSRDGDLNGDAFPSWLLDIVGRQTIADLPDKRGECIYSACTHYKRCFIEASVRKARQADIVVANHALIIESFRRIQRQAEEEESGGATQNDFILRAIFDEGHNLFNCADSAFSVHLTGATMAEVRRWLIGAGDNRRAVGSKGLEARLRGLLQASGTASLHRAIESASFLPAGDWLKGNGEALFSDKSYKAPAAFDFLKAIHALVDARADKRSNRNSYYSDEYALPIYSEEQAGEDKLFSDLLESAKALHVDLQTLAESLTALYKELDSMMDLTEISQEDKNRIRGCLTSLQARALEPVIAWSQMLHDLSDFEMLQNDDSSFSWFVIERRQSYLRDIGFYRHYIDPMQAFSKIVLENLHGGIITSATLTDDATSKEGWNRAYRHSGVAYLQGESASHHRVISPFDYKTQSGVIIINDLDLRETDSVATAYADLFCASGGGALGIFTAIKALNDTHSIIRQRLMQEHIPLYAQHVDGYHLPDLIQIFKHEEDSCLLGTDALRDGVDVPGKACRLVVFDKVPWHRRSLLLKARLKSFGDEYDEMLARLALRQAFGRLIRSENDRGLFVMLDSNRLPSKLLTAFPEGVEIHRLGLAEAVQYVREFNNGG